MGKFLVRRTATGYKFDLLAANGQDIAASEVYETKAACVKGIRSVQKYAPVAKFLDLTRESPAVTNPRFELFCDKGGDYRFRLRSRNGAVIAVSAPYSGMASKASGPMPRRQALKKNHRAFRNLRNAPFIFWQK